MIKLSDFQKKYRHNVNHNLSFSHLGRLKRIADLDFDVFLESRQMNLQRGLVWTQEQKQSLILTILRDQKISTISVVQDERLSNRNASDKYQWKVIDGKQRLTTYLSFIENEFPIEIKGVLYYFKDLPEDCQKQILWYDQYTITVHYNYNGDIADDIMIDLFEDINWLGTPQDVEHLKHLKKLNNDTTSSKRT